ncbi:MAG TPA: MFS transporter [Stellaceae bacterium]|nr:MFS transporter [Stellaceae bacterium]
MRRVIGMDIHRTFAEVVFWEAGKLRPAGRVSMTRAGLEATGNAMAVVRVLSPYVGRVIVANPLQFKAIAHAHVKTDKIDAGVLASLRAADFLPEIWLPDAETERQRRLVARRNQVVRQRTRIKNEVHAILHAHLIPPCPHAELFGRLGRIWLSRQVIPDDEQEAIDRHLRELDRLGEDLAALDREIAQAAVDDPTVKRLLTITVELGAVVLGKAHIAAGGNRRLDRDHGEHFVRGGFDDAERPRHSRVQPVCRARRGVLRDGHHQPVRIRLGSMSGHIVPIYGWSHEQIGWLFTLFVILQSIGTLPGGVLRDRFGPRWTTAIGGLFSGLGILALALGRSYALVVVLWCIGSFFTGFIYNNAVTTGNKWFPDRRGLMTGLIAGAFPWGPLPFIFPIRAIPHNSPPVVFFDVIYIMAVFFGVIYIMAGIIGGVSIIARLLMKDPPPGWQPAGWVTSQKAVKRPSEHHYTVGEALTTWQMWVLIISFVLISSVGLAGISKIVGYSNSFEFAATAAAGIAIANGFGKLILGGLSERFGPENMMIVAYVLCGILLLVTIFAGITHHELLFVCSAILAIFFWASLFSLFPITSGHYFGETAAGGNYGVLYAIAKGSGGFYGGILSTILIKQHGFSVASASLD